MRIYLSPKKSVDKSFKNVSNIASLDMVLDGEVRTLIVDNFISAFSYSEIDQVIMKIIKKLRLGAEFIVIEPDLDLLSIRYFRDEIDIEKYNSVLFQNNRSIKSILTCEFLSTALSKYLTITEKSFDENLSQFMIKCRRDR